MSDQITIVAERRTVTGKKVKRLRQAGWVPGVVYGRSEPVKVQMRARELRRALQIAGGTQLANLDVGDRQFTVLAREVQQHVTRGDILHVDFLEVDLKATIRAEAELVAIGEAEPETEGYGSAMLIMHNVEIESLPDALVSQIEVDLSQIKTPSDVIVVADLVVPEGVTIIAEPDEPVVRFEVARASIEEEEAEAEEEALALAADEVEVIGKGREEEEVE